MLLGQQAGVQPAHGLAKLEAEMSDLSGSVVLEGLVSLLQRIKFKCTGVSENKPSKIVLYDLIL